MSPHTSIHHESELRNMAHQAADIADRLAAIRSECERLEQLLLPTLQEAAAEPARLAGRLALQLSRAACSILNTEALRDAATAITERPFAVPLALRSSPSEAGSVPSVPSPTTTPQQKGLTPCNA